MSTTEPASAIVIRVPLPSGLDRLRNRWDIAARAGVPAHVTILYPFLAASDLTSPHRSTLSALGRRVEPFEITFRRVGRFPTVVYLVPEPAAPLTTLTDAIVARYPDHPPYGGAFDDVIPHLTVTDAEEAPLDAIAAEAARWLPFTHHATALEVLVESPEGRWRRRWRLPLGIRR
jgi:2'-5' RNA ligase